MRQRSIADVSLFLDRERNKVITDGSDDFTPRHRTDACEKIRCAKVSVNRSIE